MDRSERIDRLWHLRRAADHFHLVGEPRPQRHVAAAFLQEHVVHRGEHRHDVYHVQHVRFDLLPQPVSPDHSGLFSAGRRAAHGPYGGVVSGRVGFVGTYRQAAGHQTDRCARYHDRRRRAGVHVADVRCGYCLFDRGCRTGYSGKWHGICDESGDRLHYGVRAGQ